MNRYEHLARLLSFDDWANRELLTALQARPDPAAVRAFAHLVSTQFLWQDRVAHRPLSTPFWPDWDIRECALRLDMARNGWRNFLRGLDSAALDTTIRYINTKGSYYTSTLGDVISHVLFHGAHHRGQVAAALRAAGAEPPTTDFIHAVRTGALGPGGD